MTISSASIITNSLIYQNGSTGAYYGIHLGNPSSSPTIRNNTIVQNVNEGIRFVGASNKKPVILNSIVYYNGGVVPLVGLNPDAVAYNCCITDCNEVNSNFNDEPGFAYTTEPNNLPVVGNYHLAYDSPCVDTGDSNEYTDELDLDGEPRVDGTLVDRGGDEAYSCDQNLTEDDIFNPQDWNADGLVNMEEFVVFSSAWLTEDPNEAFDSRCDLDNDDDVDLADLRIFCDPNNWLWKACWEQSLCEMYGTYGMMGMGGESVLVLGEAAVTMTVPMASTAPLEPETLTEKSIAEQLLTLKDCAEFLEKIWLEDPTIQQEIDPDDWQKFIDSIYDSAVELKTQLNQLK